MTVDNHGTEASSSSSAVLGCVLALTGNCVIAIGLHMQKVVHNRGVTNWFYSTQWLLGISLLLAGEAGNLAAYGFAPASLVAPLGAISVMMNIVLARIYLKEQLKRSALIGCIFCIVGTLTLVLSSSSDGNAAATSEQRVDPAVVMSKFYSRTFALFATILGLVVLGCLASLFIAKRRSLISMLFIANSFAGVTVLTTKPISAYVRKILLDRIAFLIESSEFIILVIILLLCGIAQLYFLNLALMHFDASIVVPTNYVLFSGSAIFVGIVFYGEWIDSSVGDQLLFVASILACIVGVFLINRNGSSGGATHPIGQGNSTSQQPLLSAV